MVYGMVWCVLCVDNFISVSIVKDKSVIQNSPSCKYSLQCGVVETLRGKKVAVSAHAMVSVAWIRNPQRKGPFTFYSTSSYIYACLWVRYPYIVHTRTPYGMLETQNRILIRALTSRDSGCTLLTHNIITYFLA